MSNTLVVAGGAAVGKSALTLRFVRNEFVAVYEPTVEDAYRKHVETGDGDIGMVEIIDTAGTEQFRTMRELYYKNSDGFVLACSVDQVESIDELVDIHKEILRVKESENISMIIAVNKTDIPKSEWRINAEHISQLAKEWKISLFHTSAKQNENVTEAFTHLVSLVRNSNSKPSTQDRQRRRGLCNLL